LRLGHVRKSRRRCQRQPSASLSSPTSEPQLNIHQTARPCYICRQCTKKIYGVTYFALLASQSSEVDCCIRQQSMQRLRMVSTCELTKYSHIAECIPTFDPEHSSLRPRMAEELTLWTPSSFAIKFRFPECWAHYAISGSNYCCGDGSLGFISWQFLLKHGGRVGHETKPGTSTGARFIFILQIHT